MTSMNLARKEDIIKCLIERQNGINIQESNKYISEIEVNHNILYKNNFLIIIEKFHEYKGLSRTTY